MFRLKENGTNVKTEIFAGIATFLTMAYIVFVNPSILVQAVGVDASSPLYQQFFGAFMVATILGSATATLVMAFFANYPFALAPGMGLNAYFTYTVCLGMGIDWKVALAAVFVEGLIFIGLTLVGFRKFVAGIIPESIKVAISAGIGFFIAFIGLRSAGIVVSNPATSVALGDLTNPGVLVTVVGLLVIVAFYHRKIPGAVMIGILVATLVGAIPGIGVTKYQGIVGPVPDISPTFMKLDFSGFLNLDFWIVVLTFFFVDFFDTLGTITGLAQSAGFAKNGELPRANRAFLADAIGTSVGALFGTSTVTTYIESGAGIAEGGRTGLTALVVALCMLAMLFFAPLAQTVPGYATAPALIFVGALMIGNLGRVKWDDITEALPAFITVITMPLTYSIANGIALGIISYALVKFFSGKSKEVHWFTWILALAFALWLLFIKH
ncbi:MULTISPECIES: NCS2 family permease [unclassified Thermotoga]|uniref:NCS2 family permease n=1 Tax=unclassified Thermotoga TaxID=2631113 RepID=UPI0005433604|nr:MULTISPECIES: NCS2 family permease [unclassified Thermotoga]KAF2959907.1 guanine permease [Thermotoga sp. 38H-to]KHC90391.1 hypothetical protein Mc24_08524 [Thermotoga sp. Mc24]